MPGRQLQARVIPIALALGAVYLWTYDLSWWRSSPSSLTLALALAVTYWFGRPWQRRMPVTQSANDLPLGTIGGALVFLFGQWADSALVMTLGWTLVAYAYVSARFSPNPPVRLQRLIPFVLLAFPWILLEGDTIGWYFRYTGALANEWLFVLGGLEIHREGVRLLIEGLPVDVAEDCDGLETLQAMLAAGGVLGYAFFHDARSYWLVWPTLLLFAWIANTLRIFLFAVVGLGFGSDFVMGDFHDWGGALAVSLMFALCAAMFMLLHEK